MSRSILITGGSGFIGSNFIRYMIDKYPHYQFVNLDKLTYAGNQQNLAGIDGRDNYQFVHGDIDDFKHVLDTIRGWQCSAIVNFAAESHVDRSISSGREFMETNILGTQTVLEAARTTSVSRVVHISTDEVYGSRARGSFSERDRLDPSSPYSASKAAADLVCHAYRVTYGMPIIVTRSSNNFGPYQYPEKLIPLLITNAMEDKMLPIYGDGKNVRDWIYVEDNCAGIDAALHHGVVGATYNIGGGNEIENIKIAESILRALKKPKSLINFVADRPGHDLRYSIKCEKIKKLGWEPQFSFKDALKKTIGWYQENTDWWQKIKEESVDD